MITAFRISLFAVLVGSAIACDRPVHVADSAAAAKSQAMTAAGDVFLARREAQAHFDSARARFVAKDLLASARSLREAASFARGHADSVIEPATTALKRSADELDGMASRVAKGRTTSLRALDRVLARAQLAEVQYHCVRALDAWKSHDGPVTGAELTMLVDHFERAATDGRQALSASASSMIAETRAVATKLMQGTAVEGAKVDSALATMDKEVHALMAALR